MVTSTAERIGHREGVSDTLDRRYTSPNFTAWLPAAALVIVESSASASSQISNAP